MLIGVTITVVAIVALLAIPLELLFRVSWRGHLEQDVRVSWAFGLVRPRVGPRSAAPRDPATLRQASTAAARAGAITGALRLPEFRRCVLRFLTRLWRSIRKRDVRARLRLGLGDPADTGQLWALLGPLAAVLALARQVSLRLEPDFTEAALEFDSSGSIRLIPGQILLICAALLLSQSFWQGARAMRRRG